MPCLRFAAAVTALLPLPAQGTGKAILMLRDAQRQPVAEVQGVLLFDPPVEMPALDAIGGIDGALGLEARIGLTDASRRTGLMSCPFPADAVSAALLLTTPSGLGVFLPRVLRGEPLPVQLEPCGHVRAADGKPFTLFANVLVAGRRIALPAMQADDVPLPPGIYEGWIDTASGIAWQRLAIAPQATTTVATAGPAVSLRRAGDAVVWPAGRRDCTLLGPDRDEVRLLGLAAASPLVARTPDGALRGFSARAAGGGADRASLQSLLGEAPTVHEFAVAAADGSPLAGGTALVVRSSATGVAQVLAECPVAAGRCRVPVPVGGDDWLVVVATGVPPLALPWSEAVREEHLQVAAGHDLDIRCAIGSGEPAIDVRLEVVPERAAPATLVLRTDRRGQARLSHAPLPATVLAADPAFANATATAATDGEPVQMRLDPGLTLRGKVVLPDGTPAGGATITLRDPNGRLRPRERVATTSADGSFAFAGLAEADYSLFATQQRAGHTWSSRIVRARGNGVGATIEIRDEDPQLLPPGR